jgi:hypothetical protein
VSGPKNAIVTRNYRLAPDECAHALELLLKTSVRKEGSPVLATLEDTRGETKHVSRTTQNSTK